MARSRAAFVLLPFLLSSPAVGDVVLDWNAVLLDAVRVDRTAPPKAARAMAATHVAIFDAVNGIAGGYSSYTVVDEAPAGASLEAAAAAAAHTVLADLFPAQVASFDLALATSLSGIPDGAAEDEGVAWGESVAATILERCHTDASDALVPYESGFGGGWWIPTPPANAPPALPQWPSVRPWTMRSGSQFRPEGPPSTRSREYSHNLREVRLLGSATSTRRTADQTQIAHFWADGPGTATPPGHWLEIAAGIAGERQLSSAETARLLALLSLAVADSAIVSWDSKYTFDHWRPYTGILAADQDGNPDTVPEAGWTPLIATPPFPSYVSGHSTFSGAAAKILARFFGADGIEFATGSDDLPGVTRSFSTFSAAAEEAGQSRIYGGIHWQYDNQDGLAAGRALAEHVFDTQLLPLAPIAPCVGDEEAVCLAGRFRVTASAVGEAGDSHPGVAIPGAPGAQFWFFSEDNPEILVKVLDGCPVNEHQWIFVAGLTHLEVVVEVVDTLSGRRRRYTSPLGEAFEPIHDTRGFGCSAG